MSEWYQLSIEDVFTKLNSSQHGLSDKESKQRLEKHGKNILPEQKTESLLKIFIDQFKSPLIYVLLLCSIIVILLKDLTDGLIIFFVIILNSVIGTIQEGKAQNTLLALKKFSETSSTVLREGKELIIPDTHLIPGDIIIIREGEKVPADARLITTNNLTVDEASITGENLPVFKITDSIKNKHLPIHSQKNIILKGTNIISGNGRAIIVETGKNTFIGKIASQISKIDTDIPLKKSINKISNWIIKTITFISIIIFLFGLLKGYDSAEIFLVVVSLAVSVIPEGLPVAITIVLATGVWRMSKKNVLVKKLQAVEALGQAKIIAVDKTGTITKNELVVAGVFVDSKYFEVEGDGYEPKGKIYFKNNVIDIYDHLNLKKIALISTLASNASVQYDEINKKWKLSGDPTEAAMLTLGRKLDLNKDDLLIDNEIISEIPFDFNLKYHAFVIQNQKKHNLYVVGAPDVLLSLCKKSKKISEYEDFFHKMSKNGMRVLAIASHKNFNHELNIKNVKNLDLLGLICMKDTIRVETIDSVKRANQAGIKVVMITGDHKLTAISIGKESGIYKEGDDIMTGNEIANMTLDECMERIENVSIFSRITPEDKAKIILAYRNKGYIIAMTGDGVNDAPSMVAADLGVSMGHIGTEVAKEASDLILLDDNFGNIVSAIEEGRNIYKTIKRVILYLFSTSAGEILTIIIALFILDYPLPILAVQIIWLNLVTDGFLNVALALEPKDKNLLTEEFTKQSKNLVDDLMITRIIIMSSVMAFGTLLYFGQFFEKDIEKAWTISLTILAMYQWFNAWNCRSENKSIFTINPLRNKSLIWMTLLVIILQIFAIYNPIMQKILKTVPLDLNEWLMIIPIASSIIFIEEIRKLIFRIKGNIVIRKKTNIIKI